MAVLLAFLQILYNTLLILLSPFLTLYLWWRFYKKGALSLFRERLWAKSPPKGPIDLIIHGVSLGEVKIALKMARYLFSQDALSILITGSTDTAIQYLSKELSCNDKLQYAAAPFDFPWSIDRFFGQWGSKATLLLVEGDIWPNFVRSTKKTIIINAKISEKSHKRLLRSSLLSSFYFHPIDYVIAQSERHQKRLASLMPAKQIIIGGHLKADFTPKKHLGNHPLPLITLASSHEGEEAFIVDVHKHLLSEGYLVHLAIAPRHPERFHQVEKHLHSIGPFSKSSQGPLHLESTEPQRILIDQMGVLPFYYLRSLAVIIGGSFGKEGIGGHNPLEPIEYGAPILTGPDMQSQKDLMQLLEDKGLSFSFQTKEECCTLLKHLINNKIESINQIESLQGSFSNIYPNYYKLLKSIVNPLIINH